MKEISNFPAGLARDIIGLWILITSSLCVGLLINQFRDRPLPLYYQDKEERVLGAASAIATDLATAPASSATEPLPEELDLDSFKEFLANKRGVVLDARPEIFHRLGHIPGAISLPRDDFEAAFRKLEPAPGKDVNAVIYCASSSCEDASLVRKALTKLGYTRLSIFSGGWAEWTSAGLPEERAQ